MSRPLFSHRVLPLSLTQCCQIEESIKTVGYCKIDCPENTVDKLVPAVLEDLRDLDSQGLYNPIFNEVPSNKVEESEKGMRTLQKVSTITCQLPPPPLPSHLSAQHCPLVVLIEQPQMAPACQGNHPESEGSSHLFPAQLQHGIPGLVGTGQ